MNSKSRNYCFTLNNWTEDEYRTIRNYTDDAKYVIIGKERGAEGTPHLQGYVAWKNARSFTAVKTGLGARVHIECAKGSGQSNKTYCSKEGDFYEKGECPALIGGQSLADKIAKNKRLLDPTIPLDDLIETGELSAHTWLGIKRARQDRMININPYKPDDVRGIWYWGEPGTGKTRKVWEDHPNLFETAQNKWFDGYQGEEVILLDDLDTPILGHYLKRWMDRYPTKGEVKGGTLQLRHKLFIVTSNYSIEDLFKDDPIMAAAIRRRCKVVHFTNIQ
nr:MAG: replication associated protein [Cressdnaviricota sp.]